MKRRPSFRLVCRDAREREELGRERLLGKEGRREGSDGLSRGRKEARTNLRSKDVTRRSSTISASADVEKRLEGLYRM